MKRILIQRIRELVCGESGVACAFTVTVSLIIFLLGFAIYACGETVRQRIELQNAADSAAYSAALVQADTISRVAVINKAMAWNYVMMTRRQMDHIVDAWLGRVLEMWESSRSATFNFQNICACHPRIEGINWRVGTAPGGGGGDVVHQLIRLNNSQDVWISSIVAARLAHSAKNPVALLESLRKCIDSMNQAEKELIDGMKERVENAVEFAVNANVDLTENDRKVREQREIDWTIYDLRDASEYFELLKEDESRFLSFGDFSGTGTEIYGAGADNWLIGKNSSGFQRNYVQAPNALTAVWFTYNQIWFHSVACTFGGVVVNPVPAVTGEMARDAYFTGQEARPRVLKKNYFEADGAIVVGVSRPLNNPFAFVFDGREQTGIYSAFEVGGGGQTMWSVAGARAGYRLSEWAEGEYRNRGPIQNKYNLCVTDWDAMFLPLREKAVASSDYLSGIAKKLGVSGQFVRKNHSGSYSRLDFSAAKEHLYH